MLWLISLALAQEPGVVRAARDLPVGHVLRPADVEPLPAGRFEVPPGALRDPAAAAGRQVKVPIFLGELIRGEYLGGTVTVPEALVPQGHWALAVSVRTDADEVDLVGLQGGRLCVAARGVTVLRRDPGLVAVPAASVPRALAVLADASARRADSAAPDCR